MPQELKQIRLPDSWNPGLNKEKISPRMYLNTINLDLPISGGWGYVQKIALLSTKMIQQ